MMLFKIFICFQLTFNMLDIKEANNEYNLSAWKAKWVCNSMLEPLHDLTFNTKNFIYKIGLQFQSSVLVVE